MRSTFSSYNSPVYSPSSSRSSVPSFSSRLDSTNAPFSRTSSLREPITRNSPRESFSSRANSLRSSQNERRSPGPVSSRVPRCDETNSLLERYGVRKTSVGESSSQSVLNRRKQSEPDGGLSARRTSLEYGGARDLGAGPSGLGTVRETAGSSSRPSSQLSSDAQNLSQQDYMSRLMSAHNRVDELLKSRGLNSDDENKYLRAWEQIPIIREQRYRRIRTPSNSSDSGLSTDNDSDRSHSEPIADEVTCEETLCKKSVCLEDVFVMFTSQLADKVFLRCQASGSILSAIFPSMTKTEERQRTLTTWPVKSRRSVSIRLSVKQNLSGEGSTEKQFTKPSQSESIDKIFPGNVNCSTSAVFPPYHTAVVKKTFHFRRRRVSDNKFHPSAAVLQKTLLAGLRRKNDWPIPSTAEISIQHCSFYQVSKMATVGEVPEKNVRINLRLTERAPKHCVSSISLPSPPKTACVRFDVVLPEKRTHRRTRTVSNRVVTLKRYVGKLDRSSTVDLADAPKEHRKVNRLKIPEYFLQQSAEAYEDFNNIKSKLKQVNFVDKIIGGFSFEAKPPQLRRTGAIRRRTNTRPNLVEQLSGTTSEPFSDFLPSTNDPPGSLELNKEQPPDPPPSQTGSEHKSDSLNWHGSLTRTATCSGARTRCESPIAELSETDRRLVEQYRRSLHIPRPTTLQRLSSPILRPLRLFLNQVDYAKPANRVQFVRRRSPTRLVSRKLRSPTPPRLNKIQKSDSRFLRRNSGPDWSITLKRVDRSAPLRPKPKKRKGRKWIPQWRKRSSDEEVEEVEEEEEEEEASTDVRDENSTRPKTKSFTDEGDACLTEGEKAMAAVKRRHEEDQQAKLMDYEERRRIERDKEEEELRKLKEKQEKRRLEREQEEKEQNEKKKLAEDQRKREEEERKAKIEEDRRRKMEEKTKRQQMTGAAFTGGAGRNFTIPKKVESKNEKFGNIVQAKQEMGMTKDQQEQAKSAFLAQVKKELPVASSLLPADIKAKIKELHQRICKLETDKYDLERKHERQEYDLKELNERQRQVARNTAQKKGLDPAEAASSRHPPRVLVRSKFDRQRDERTFCDRREIFVKLNSVEKEQSLARGSARPPADWGKKVHHEDIEEYLNHPQRCPKYTEKVTEDAATPVRITPKPLSIPSIFKIN